MTVRTRAGLAASAVALSLAMSSCVGSTSRADFEADVQARGGGVTGDRLAAALDVVADEVQVVATDDLEILTLRADAGNRNISVQVRRGDQASFVDQLVLRGTDVLLVEPIQDADRFDLDEAVVRAGELPIDDVETLIDRAIAEFDDVDTVLVAFSVRRVAGDPVIVVDLESPRRTGTIEFDLDGAIREEPS